VFPVTREDAPRTIDYVLRDLTSPEGGFYSAEDADSEGEEGKFYTWTYEEAEEVCGYDFEVMRRAFDIKAEGNWEGRTILRLVAGRNTIPDALGISVEEFKASLNRGREKMLAARSRRPRPARDDKVVTSWNGLMLAAVAEAGAVLQRDDYLAAAQRNADFLLAQMYQDGRVLRTYRGGPARLNGYLEDYAALANGLLQMYFADFNPRWYGAAVEIADIMLQRFADPDGGLFYSVSDDHESLLYRPKDFDDNAIPAGNSLAVEVLIKLSLLSGEDRYRQQALTAAAQLAPSLASHPLFFGRLLSALDLQLSDPIEIAFVGEPGEDNMLALINEVRAHYLPSSVVAAGPPGSSSPPLLQERGKLNGRAAAYVCRGFVCSQPVDTVEGLRAQLSAQEPAQSGWQAV